MILIAISITQDLAVRTIEELWFTNLADQPALNDSSLQTSVPCGIQAKTSVFIGVAGFFKERQNPIESFLVQVSRSCHRSMRFGKNN